MMMKNSFQDVCCDVISWRTVTAFVYNTAYSELTACNPLSLADRSTGTNKTAYLSRNNDTQA